MYKLTSAIQTVPELLLSNLLLMRRATRMSNRLVSGLVMNTAFCCDQVDVPVKFSVDKKRSAILYASQTWNLGPLSDVMPCTRMEAEKRYRVLGWTGTYWKTWPKSRLLEPSKMIRKALPPGEIFSKSRPTTTPFVGSTRQSNPPLRMSNRKTPFVIRFAL